MRGGRRAIAAALLLGALARSTPADPPRSPYDPAPEGLLALVATPSEEEAATRAAAAIVSPNPETAREGRNDLLAAGPAGLKLAAETLARGPVPADAELLLLQVVAASPRREADAILARAARRPQFEVRALAAFGLGAYRTPAAVGALEALARDAIPAVRGVALRALFASEDPAARAARLALPAGSDDRVLALRLRLHRLRGDDGPLVGRLAWRAWRSGRSEAVRLEAARCLALAGCAAPSEVLEWIVMECGEGAALAPFAARFLVAIRGGYPAGGSRLAASEALLALLGRPDLDPKRREILLDTAVRWIARPMRIRGRQVDLEAQELLIARLPDAGKALVRPVVERLAENGFDDPSHGTALLAVLPEDLSIPACRGLADPRAGAASAVAANAAAVLGTLGRIGDEGVARAMLAKDQLSGIRRDAVRALARDPAAYAIPLLADALIDADLGVVSDAATTLLARPEPAARAALEALLLGRRWDYPEPGILARLSARAADDDWRLLERLVLEGIPAAKDAVFDLVAEPRSPFRGPRAEALIRMAREKPELGIGVMPIAKALAPVNGADAVAYVRENSPKAPREVALTLLRDLQVANDPSAAAYALEIAAATKDADDTTLGVVMAVLLGPCPKTAAMLDPFWRRVIVGPSDVLRQRALEYLPRIPHGPMADLALPILRDENGDAKTRIAALAVVASEAFAANEALFWDVAARRAEDEDLRAAAATALVGKASPEIRAKAVAWLEEPLEEASAATKVIALLAGTGASSAEASRLLSLLDAAVAKRYAAAPPYFAPVASDDPYPSRVLFLCEALGASGDAASLEALSARLFDPRFAAWASEARRADWLGEAVAVGPLGALDDPPTLAFLLHETEGPAQAMPITPGPPEISWIVGALAHAGSGAAAERIARAVEAARNSGRLARVSDAYLVFLAKRLRAGDEETSSPGLPEAGAAAEQALPFTFPADDAEELDALDRQASALAAAARFGEAADAQAGALRLAARLGIADLPPSIWIERGTAVPPSWKKRKAAEDLLRGAAAAALGKAGEARDAFRRGEALAPLDWTTLHDAAFLRASTGFEPEVAEALARRALDLLARAGSGRGSADFRATILRTLALALHKQGKFEEEKRVLEEAANGGGG